MDCKEEDQVLFATTIAMELAKGLSLDELEDLRCFINQISSSLSCLIFNKYARIKRKNQQK